MSDPTDPPEDPAAALLRGFQNSPSQKLMSELANSPSAQLAREMANSPSAKLMKEYATSPAAKLARDLAESPAAAILRDVESTAKLARGIGLPSSAELTAVASTAKTLAGITIDPAVANVLAGVRQLHIESPFADAIAKITPIAIPPAFAAAISEARRVFSDFGNVHGGFANAMKAIEEQKSLVASLTGTVGDIARMSQWASTLGRIKVADISKLYPALPNLTSEVTRLHESIGSIGVDQQNLSAVLGLDQSLSASLESTRFKMSAFAGVTDMIGPQTSAWREAYQSLFGEWRTRPDLPENFWRDARVRRRMYDAASVDSGLARADLAVAVEVIVESGLASGVRSDTDTVAVIGFGDVSMAIRSRGTRHDAYRVLERFEEELRAYITRKLSEKCGPDWFKLRVDGNVAGDAKRIRRQALERGEASMPLINYTELGHLSSIIQACRNWDEVFGDTFINSTAFDHDMQKLVAARRPTMHIRPIDGLRLVELICVVQRLSRQMEDDGAWKTAAEAQH